MTNTTITMSQLSKLICNTAEDAVDEHLKQLKRQKTNWMDQIQGGGTPSDDPLPGHKMAQIVRTLCQCDGDPHRAKERIGNQLGQKALAAGDLTAGGVLVAGEIADEFIDLLRPKSVVRAANPDVWKSTSSTVTFPKLTGDATAAYVGENQEITVSQPTTGDVRIVLKKLASIVPLSKELVNFAHVTQQSADQEILQKMVMAVGEQEDISFLRGNGMSDTPKGLLYSTAEANKTATNGTSSANIESDFKDLIQDLEGNNVPMLRPVWFMNPRSKNHLINLRETGGNLTFPEIRGPNPILYGWPVLPTTNIPVNLGGGANETEIYLTDASEIILGEFNGVEVQIDDAAPYKDTAGAWQSAFTRDQVLVKVILYNDLILRHDVSCAIKTGVTWGA